MTLRFKTAFAIIALGSFIGGYPAMAQTTDDVASADVEVNEDEFPYCSTDETPSRSTYRLKSDAEAIFRCEFEAPPTCYPSLKFREKVELSFTINTDGEPEDIKVIKSSNSCLDGGAYLTLDIWRFEKLDEPEVDARMIFKVYNHSNTIRNNNAIREMGRSY